MASIFIEPLQKRWVDPYDEIIPTNDVNEQLCALINARKGIVYGLNASYGSNSQTIHLSSGTSLIDSVMIDTGSQNIPLAFTSYSTGKINVLYMKFEYHLEYPLYEAKIDVTDAQSIVPDDTILVIAFIEVDNSGNIVSITDNSNGYVTYTVDKPNPVIAFLYNIIINEYLDLTVNGNLNMNNHKIVNLADPQDNLDAVNKHYADQVISNSHVIDQLVLVDELEKNPTDYENPGSGWFLDNQIKTDHEFGFGFGTFKTIMNNAGNKYIMLNKSNKGCKISSGDSSESII